MNTLPEAPVKYCGRLFTPAELDIILQIISRCLTRRAISIQMCAALNWTRPDGQSKEMSARVALLRMERDGLLELPAPTHSYTTSRKPVFTAASDPEPEFSAPCSEISFTLRRVAAPDESILWNEMIERYHYLGYQPLPGAQARYLVRDGERLLGALGFGAAAWKVAARDSFIGWTPDERRDRLRLVVNNARFLILPWIHVKNLASRILSLAARQVYHDWPDLYGYRPALLETFVERDRFTGTCYRAANWTYVGCTQGRGKLDCHHRHNVPVKDVYLYPLDRRFRQLLAGGMN